MDSEIKVRAALSTLLRGIWPSMPLESFSSVQKIVLTYICSGLTSLTAGTDQIDLFVVDSFYNHIATPLDIALPAH